MGNVSIKKDLAQMDGIFGCKVVTQDDKTISIKEKNFFEWVRDILFDLHVSPVSKPKMLAALDVIAGKIKGAETGEFATLLKSYRCSDKKIDLNEIKKTLEKSLDWEFLPIVYSENANASKKSNIVDQYEHLYLKNMRKSICTENSTMSLIADSQHSSISHENLIGYRNALETISLETRSKFTLDKGSEAKVSLILATFEMAKRKETASAGRPYIQMPSVPSDEIDKCCKNIINENPENYKVSYLSKITDYMSNSTADLEKINKKIEMLADAGGGVSDENIAALVGALVETEYLKERELDVSKTEEKKLKWEQSKEMISKIAAPVEAIEASTDIIDRVVNAYVEFRMPYLDKLRKSH